MRFPNGPSTGNCVPKSTLGTGCAFRIEPQAETASRFEASEWDAVSFWVCLGKWGPESGSRVGHVFPLSFWRKACPRIELRSGMRFPKGAGFGKCVPLSCLILGCVFRLGFNRKVHPTMRAHSGMRFPIKVDLENASHSGAEIWVAFSVERSFGKCIPV